jgi:hypothetical protein
VQIIQADRMSQVVLLLEACEIGKVVAGGMGQEFQ